MPPASGSVGNHFLAAPRRRSAIQGGLDEPSAAQDLKHKRALWREEADSEALKLAAPENQFLPSVQLDLEGKAALRAAEDAKGMPAGPSFQDSDAPVLDTPNHLAVEFEPPIHQTGRTPLLSLDAETRDRRDRGFTPRSHGVAPRRTGGRLPDVCRPLVGRIDRLPRSVERFQTSFGISVSGMQVGMTGPDRIAESTPNVFPRRCLVDPKKGKQRSFIRGASHLLETLGGARHRYAPSSPSSCLLPLQWRVRLGRFRRGAVKSDSLHIAGAARALLAARVSRRRRPQTRFAQRLSRNADTPERGYGRVTSVCGPRRGPGQPIALPVHMCFLDRHWLRRPSR